MYPYNAGDTHRESKVAPSTLRQTLHMNIQFNFNTKSFKLLCYSNKTYNASSLPAGDAKLGQSNTQSTISYTLEDGQRESRTDAASRYEP